MPIWSADREVTPAEAATLIEGQFPKVAPVRLTPLGCGWDNTAYLANDEFVFRFPRRAIAVALVEREVKTLPSIAEHVSLAVPSPVFIGEPTPEFDWPFVGYRFIAGRTACSANLTHEDRQMIAPRLGEFLRELHSIPVADGLAVDPTGSLDVERRVPKIQANVAALWEHGLFDISLQIGSILSSASGLVPESQNSVTHGDLYVRHLVVDDTRKLTGVIDWGDVQRNDPAIDLAIVFHFLPPGAARDRFWRAYGNASPTQLCLARFSALDHVLTVLRYGHEIGDEDLAREGRLGVEYVLAAAT